MDEHRCNEHCRGDVHVEIVAGLGSASLASALWQLRMALANTWSVSVIHAEALPERAGTWLAYWVA